MIVAGQATRAANVETAADISLTGDSRHIPVGNNLNVE
jgi:hypothetical protein